MPATAAISNVLRGARRTTSGRQRPGQLEPSLEGRFREGLFFAGEGHVEPRRVLPKLHERIIAAGGTIKFNSDVSSEDLDGILRGLAARDTQASCAASRAR